MTTPTEPTPPEQTAAPADSAIPQDDKTMAMLAHGLPILVGFWAPLIIWFLKKDQSAYINEQAKEALNFQITVLIAFIISMVLCLVFIGLILIPIVGIADLVFCIIAAMAANKGEHYKYPFAIRLIK